MAQIIAVLDFGSQYTQIIARRIRECSVYSKIYHFSTPAETLRSEGVIGIILSGGPSSVFSEKAPLPDEQIFGKGAAFSAARLYKMARSKAYLYPGVEIRWKCLEKAVAGTDAPAEAVLHFPGGLTDFLSASLAGRETVRVDFVDVDRRNNQRHRR